MPGEMCARRAPRQADLEPETPVPLIVTPSPAPELPVGMGDEAPEDSGADDLGDLFALSDESYRDVVWYVWRRRSPGEVSPKANPNAAIYCAKMVGPIDLDELAKLIGGGVFRLVGYRNGRKFIERPLEIEGPRKSQTLPTPPPVVPNGAAAQGTVDVAAVIAAGFDRMFAMIEQKMTPPTAPTPAAPAFQVKDLIEMAKMMQPAPQSPDANVVSSMIGMLKEGIQLGSTREAPTGTDWAQVFEKALPLADKLVSGLAARRGVPPRRPPGQPVPPSRAEVVPDQPTAQEPPQEPQESVRMAAVVDSLSRAIESMGTDQETEPADFAATVEQVLLPAELSMLRLSTTDGLMSELASVSDRYPAFATPQARPFVDAVLAELRTPPES